jgi:molybdopterin adenylyltransferase
MNGKVAALCISERKGERKTTRPSVTFLAGQGIQDDAHAGACHRQISLLAEADIDDMRRKGLPGLKAGDFAENVIVTGLAFDTLGLGSRLLLGKAVELEVSQIGKTCHARCAIYHQTGDCIMPRLGLFAKVLKGGPVATGDSVALAHLVPRDAFQVFVLTVSDRCSRGEATDTAGPAVARLLESALAAHVYKQEIVPDEQHQIAERLRHHCDGHSIDLAIAVGGTGFAPRDVTPEAVTSIIERPTPGLDEAMRQASMQKTPHAMLSRATSGILGQTLVLSLPGSERAAVENLQAILPALGHGLAKLRGDPSDCGRPEPKGTANGSN